MDRTLKPPKRTSKHRVARNIKAWTLFSPDGSTNCRYCPHDRKVETHLNMMSEQGVSGWQHSEIIATLEARTISGCPDPENQEQLDIMRECFSEAVQETANPAPLQ